MCSIQSHYSYPMHVYMKLNAKFICILILVQSVYCMYVQIADEKLYEHWRSNCPKLREVESRELEKHVVGEWSKQKERKEQVILAQLYTLTFHTHNNYSSTHNYIIRNKGQLKKKKRGMSYIMYSR